MTMKVYAGAAAVFTAAFFLVSFASFAGDYESLVIEGLERQESGDRKAALEIFRKAADRYPEEPASHFLLGRAFFLMQKGDEAEKEFRLYRQKVDALAELKGDAIGAHISNLFKISEIYFILGRFTQAKETNEEIIRLDPKNQSAYYNLGIYYYNHEHNRSTAYNNFKKVVDLDKNSDTAKKAEYAIGFIRNNPDPRVSPDFSFIDKE